VHIILEGDGADNLNTLGKYVSCVAHNLTIKSNVYVVTKIRQS
jgi:hypothetical protein